MAVLKILGAAYGPADVTAKVRSLRKNQQLSVKADNSVFGDPWKTKTKSLVVVYQYDDGAPSVSIVQEGQTLTIERPSRSSRPSNLLAMEDLQKINDVVSRTQSKAANFKILGAAYGLADVTSKARSFVKDGVFNAVANNATWGDSWRTKTKTLVVVYEYNGVPSMVNVAIENNRMYFIASPALHILGASYGPADRTQQVISLVKNAALKVVADNETFGDTWKTKTKALVVIYQYGEEEPIVAIAEEGLTMNIVYKPGPAHLPPADSTNLNILGAAYGLGDVTDKVKNLTKGNELDFTADNSTFGDTWYTKTKSFTLVYQYGRNQPLQTITIECGPVKVNNVVSPRYTGQIQTRDLLDTGDTISLSASNNKFITCDTKLNGKLSSVKDLPDETTTFIVEKDKADSTLRLKTSSGKYVTIGADKLLFCNGSSSEAAKFEISLSTNAGIRLASSTNQKYARLHSDGQSIIMDAAANFTLNTFFGIALQQTPTEVILKRHGIVLDARLSLSPCDTARLSFLWKITGGFFLAIGLGPYISTGTPEPGLLALIKCSPRAWAAVQNLVAFLQTGGGTIATVISLIGLIKIFYQEGLLWSIFKMMITGSFWHVVTVALAEVLAIVLAPELEAAKLLASSTVWAVQTVKAGLDVASACN